MCCRDEQSDSFLNSDTVGDEFFIDIVERKLKISREKFKLRLVLLQPATGKNDNFASVVYRAKIKIEFIENGERQTVSVIIKALLSTMEELKKFSVFPRECFIYEDILPSFEKIWLERANEVVKFGPDCIKIQHDPYEIIVLDDLKANGYEMLDRKNGFTLSEAKLALAKLAKFHAAGTVRYQKDGILQVFLDRKLSIPPEMLSEDNPFMQGFKRMYHEFITALRSYGDCDKYADKIASWDPKKLFSCWVTTAEPMSNGFRVLSHGDAWLNNIMLRSDEDALLLDFQGPSWATPALDLHYFIVSSVHDDVKIVHFDEMIKFYYKEIAESLTKLKYDGAIPTFEEFTVDLDEKGSMAATSIMFILFIVKYESGEEINLEDMMKAESADPEIYTRIYRNETYKKAVKILLPFLDKKGYLDVLLPSNN